MTNNSIFQYLQYLRDSSRHLSVSGDLYKCLLQKGNRKKTIHHLPFCDFSSTSVSKDENNLLYSIFSNYQDLLKKETNKQVFIGIGAIWGKYCNKKIIFGSLINIPINFEFKEDNRSFEISYDLNNKSINYDLLTALLPDFFGSDDMSNNELLNAIFFFENSINNFHDIATLATAIDKFIEDFNDININNQITYNHILKYTDNYEHSHINDRKNKNALLNKNQLYYLSTEFHLFTSNIPDNISTWKNLDSFCKDIKEENFNHPVLNDLFNNVFNNKYFPEISDQSMDYKELIQNIPITLSTKQSIAVENALSSKISYIQGPPGTGKSYTISAILLLGILMKKKILIVSQKTAALDVVKNKILPFFNSKLPLSFIHFTKETKTHLKSSLKQMKSFSDSLSLKSTERLQNNITKLSDELNQKKTQQKNLTTELNLILDSYSSFFESNKETSKKKENLINNPVYLNFTSFDDICFSTTDNILFLNQIKNIQIKFNNKKALTIFERNKLLKLQNKFNSFFSLNIDFLDLVNKSICYNFLEDWLQVSHIIYNNHLFQKKLSNEDALSNLRYKIQATNSEIEHIKLELFHLNHEYQLYLNLLNKDNIYQLEQFIKLLRFERDDKVLEKMNNINYEKILNIFPVFLSEIRNIGEILPNNIEMFDLVLVDESSQVNLAEIMPVFYRSKNICIVGDHLQLGLNSVGLTFSLNKKFDKITWEKYKPNNLDYNEAINKNLVITKSSILDLLQSEENQHNFKTIMLDEHFRSLPGLSSYNNKNYYNSELKIMTEVPEKALISCFAPVKVNGTKDDKINEIEALEILKIIKYLTCPEKNADNENIRLSEIISLNSLVPEQPTIGIISLIREQSNYIQDLLDDLDNEIFAKHRLICGTPEQLQGDEFDIVIFTGVVDESTRNHGHYNDSRRLNVAFSRSKFFTIFVYSSSKNIPSYFNYLKHFGVIDDESFSHNQNVLGWSYDIDKCESTFEKCVAFYLEQIKSEINSELSLEKDILIYNQVKACGMKRLDFVLYNPNNNQSAVIEVDGVYHFNNFSRKYSEEHNERIDILTRAGWKIINTPYFLWYKYGSLCVDSPQFIKEIHRIKMKILDYLK